MLFLGAVSVGYFVVAPSNDAAAQPGAQLQSPQAAALPVRTYETLPPLTTSTTLILPTTTHSPVTSQAAVDDSMPKNGPSASEIPTALPATSTSTSTPTTASHPLDPIELYEVIVIGDSLVIEADADLRRALAPARVELLGEPAMGLPGAQERIEEQGLEANSKAIVIIALGNADFNLPAGYDLMVRGALANIEQAHCIVWVSAQEISGHSPEVNDAIRRQIDRVPEAYIADWSSIADNPLFHSDETYHLSEQGASAYAALISESVHSNCLRS